MTKLENIAIATEKRLATLEANYVSLEKGIEEIKNNHLFHLGEDIKELQKSVGNLGVKFATWSGGLVVAVWILQNLIK